MDLTNITADDLLLIADILDTVRQDYLLNGGRSIIDERSAADCARVLDASLEADLRANFARLAA